jgi:hypothetical protein
MGAAEILQKLPSIAMSLAVFYILFIVGYAVYFFINRKEESVLPPTDAWWWPTMLNQYVHVYPRNYTYMSNVTAPTSFVSNTFSNVTSVKMCKTKCEGSPDDCVGFEINLASNTCVTYSSIGFPIEYTGNNLYVVEGNEPSYMYTTYSGQKANSNTLASNIASFIATSYLNCSSNCSSNVTCLGFEYKPATNECIQRTTMDSSNLVASTGTTSYILQAATLIKSPI